MTEQIEEPQETEAPSSQTRQTRQVTPQYIRALVDADDPEIQNLLEDVTLPVPFVASTEGRKADGMDLQTEDWVLDRFNNYPVILFGHDYLGYTSLPIGRGEARLEDSLKIDVFFDPDDEFAMRVRSKAIRGMMAGSVGWDTTDAGNELLEFSMVPVPLDPDALPEIQRNGLRSLRREIDKLLDAPHVEEPAPTEEEDDGSVEEPQDTTRADPPDTTTISIDSTSDTWFVSDGPTLDSPPQQTEVRYVIVGPDQLDELARAGAVLSARNKKDLERAKELIDRVLESAAKKEKDDTMEEEEMGKKKDKGRGESPPSALNTQLAKFKQLLDEKNL